MSLLIELYLLAAQTENCRLFDSVIIY